MTQQEGSGPGTEDGEPSGPDADALRRAEGMVGHLAASIGWSARRLAARAREEAEGIWTEADSIRRRQSSKW